MFHATIDTGGAEPMRFSGQVVPYDLEVLREHVLARRARATRVDVRAAAAHHDMVRYALRDVGRHGIELVLRPESRPGLRSETHVSGRDRTRA